LSTSTVLTSTDKNQKMVTVEKTPSPSTNTRSIPGIEDRVRKFFFAAPRLRKNIALSISHDLSSTQTELSSVQPDAVVEILRCAYGIKAEDRISVTADLISLCNFSPLAITNATLNKASEDKPDTDQLLALLKVIARLIVNDSDERNLLLFKWLTHSENFLVRECVCEAAANIEDDDASTLILRILSNDHDERIRNMANDYLDEA